MKYTLTMKLRYLRARFRIFTAGVRAADLRFALMAPIMGADDPPEPDPKPDPKPDDRPDKNAVAEATRARKKAEKEKADAEARIAELEGAGASEAEKERKRADKAEAEKAEAEQRAKVIERGAWVRSAATSLRAIDADAVVALVDLDAAETKEEAETLVKELGESKPALFGQRSENGDPPPGTPPGFGTPAAGGGEGSSGVPGIGSDGKVDEEVVRGNLGKGLLGLIGGRGNPAPGGQPEHEDD